jgi:arabinofuranosyltransferase
MNPPDICHPSSSSTDDKVRRSLLLGSALWLSACSLSIWYCTWDDSYIIFRYAQNLMRGLGLVYNAGQKVEGYTSFLWVLLLTVGTRLMHDPIVAAKVLGLLFNLSTLLAGYCLCRQMIIDKVPMYGLALVLTASNTYFIVGTVGGLESPLFSSILCWSVVAYLKAIRTTHLKSQTYWCVGTSLLLTLLVLTRPDGVITFFLLCCDAGWRFRKRPGNIACLTLPLVLIYTPYFLWRWHYYGLFFPNTFYVKRGGTLALLAQGVAQAGKFFGAQTGGWFLCGLVTLAVMFFPTVETTVLGLAIASRVVFEVWSGGIAPGEFRFLIPALPLIWILTENVLARGVSAFAASRRTQLVFAGTCGLLIVGQLITFCQFRVRNAVPERIGMERAHIGLGKWLRTNSPPDATVAVGDIGASGFWSQRRILDLDGLTDTYISHLPGAYSEKHDSQYVLGQFPDFIVLRASSCDAGSSEILFGMDEAVYSDPQFQDDYARVSCWEFWKHYDLLLYQRGPGRR